MSMTFNITKISKKKSYLLIKRNKQQYQNYLKNPNKHSFFLEEIEPIKILKLIKNLNPKKSSDIYGIPPKLLKKISVHSLAGQLIFNVSFQEGIFPDKFKVGVIFAIHKNDPKSNCSNYRPISIIPLFS